MPTDSKREVAPVPAGSRAANPFDHDHGYSGQEYHIERERAWVAQEPSGIVDPGARSDASLPRDETLPPDTGRRAMFDPATGAVRGSGAGAGGGNAGEDFDDDAATGSGFPFTGKGG